MIAKLESRPELDARDIEDRFLEMLPRIRAIARFAFRRQPASRREELIAEVIANAFVAFHRLAGRGRIDRAFPSPLTYFAVRQVVEGRRVGNQLNSKDLLSQYAQRRRGFAVEPLRCQHACGRWEDIVVEDKRCTPAEIAACRLDLRAWMQRLKPRQRAVALRLAEGETTNDAARRFHVSKARISQYRQELRTGWEEFQGERLAAA